MPIVYNQTNMASRHEAISIENPIPQPILRHLLNPNGASLKYENNICLNCCQEAGVALIRHCDGNPTVSVPGFRTGRP